jgi:hypothetical protein
MSYEHQLLAQKKRKLGKLKKMFFYPNRRRKAFSHGVERKPGICHESSETIFSSG